MAAESHAGQERDFHHPYQPYSIQVDFMNTLYDTIEAGGIGIFESPTGTYLPIKTLTHYMNANSKG